jgi:AcrR family transcriptional regulator
MHSKSGFAAWKSLPSFTLMLYHRGMRPKQPLFGCGPRSSYHHGSLKDALIEAARLLVAERGPAGFTLAEAAKRVGVTAAAPYRHFADRNDLMGELARRGFELFGQRLAGAWDDGKPDARQAMRRMGSAYLAFARSEPGLYAAMFVNPTGPAISPAWGGVAGNAFDDMQRATAALLGEASQISSASRQLAFELWSLSHGVAMLAMAGHLDAERGDDPASLLDRAAEALIDTALQRQAEC